MEALPRTDEQEAVAMGTAFAPSHRALPPAAARLLRLLALHPGPQFGVASVSALAAVGAPQARMLLDVLADAGFVERTAPGRHRFARDHRPAPPRDEPIALRRVLDWYLHTAGSAARLIRPHADHVPLDPPADGVTTPSFAGYDEAVDWAEREHPNLAAAVHVAESAGLARHAWQLAAVAWHAHPPSAPLPAWLPLGGAGLRAARHLGDRTAEARLLNHLGTAHRHAHHPDDALSAHTRALAVRRAEGNRAGEAAALLGLGLLHLSTRHLPEAEIHFAQSRSLSPDPHRKAAALTHLAATHHEAGRLPEAAGAIREALAPLRHSDDREALGESLRTLSAVQLDRAEPEQALHTAEEAIELALDLRNHTLEARWLLTLAAAQQALARHGQALTSYHRSATLHRRLGDRPGEALAWQGAGRTYHRMGRRKEATAFLSQSAKVHHAHGIPWHEALSLAGLATALQPGHPGEARRHRSEALRLLAAYPDPRAAGIRRHIENQLSENG